MVFDKFGAQVRKTERENKVCKLRKYFQDFLNVTIQRGIVHLICNSIKYVPNKDYRRFTAQLKNDYGSYQS